MDDLLRQIEDEAISVNAPLAARIRPIALDEFVGQDDFLAPGKILRRMLESGKISSLVFHGPAGTGKTTLAHIIANYCNCICYKLNAASASVKQVRTIIADARAQLASNGKRTVLFMDELHRFSSSQQDVLLSDVENGTIILIGATTENPFFTINTPLLSRSTVFEFKSLTCDNIITLLKRALADKNKGLGKYAVTASDEALDHLAKISDGDARRALTALEVGVMSQVATHSEGEQKITFGITEAQDSIQQKVIAYDNSGDMHYDAASALIKSMRGSDPQAAVYWLAKMLEAGEDPRFIARRIAICASEDIGNADPRAITVAASAFAITERIGMPECRITLSQAVIYLACAPKSNASYLAINMAIDDVKNNRMIPVPLHLKNAPHPGMKDLGNSVGYQYSHDFASGVSPDQDYLGVDKQYYTPTNRGYEKHISAYLEYVDQQRVKQKPSEGKSS